MKRQAYIGILLLAIQLCLAACSENEPVQEGGPAGRTAIRLGAEIRQIALTRVDDGGFCDLDAMGVYMVDYNGSAPGTLMDKGNRADHLRHVFHEAENRWEAARDIYWKDNHTAIDVYAYYPYAEPENVNVYAFEVQQNQNLPAQAGKMCSYEASDFLWGKAENIAPTENRINVRLSHLLSCIRVELIRGEGFGDGEWESLEKLVTVNHVKNGATIDLASGKVTAEGEISVDGLIPHRETDAVFRCITVPQTVPAGKPLFSISAGTVPYIFTKPEAFAYTGGKMHRFSILIHKKLPEGTYRFSLAGESVTPWESDNVSHDAVLKEYVIINAAPGKLEASIRAAGKNPDKIKNLKITGAIDATDFDFMRLRMPVLQALNLKEVICRNGTFGGYGENDQSESHLGFDRYMYEQFIIPDNALSGKKTLFKVILPDRLRLIGNNAFSGTNLTGSLHIPEGVTHIGEEAFHGCRNLTGKLSLPSTLVYIGGNGHGGAFEGCRFTGELILPENLKCICCRAFLSNENLSGNLRLPQNLEYIGYSAFSQCRQLNGSLKIPSKIRHINNQTFMDCGFNGTLELHDGILSIGSGAFGRCPLKGELHLPKDLVNIEDGTFWKCDFSGTLKIPPHMISIGRGAFADNPRLSGTLDFPEGLVTISAAAFSGCSNLEMLVFPESLENIMGEPNNLRQGGAFSNCFGINGIICKGDIPAQIHSGTFEGVSKENFVLEVPERALIQYQTAEGWREFKRISAHKELACRPAAVSTLNTETIRTLLLKAEGEWLVESLPDWCLLSAMQGTGKAALSLTVREMPHGNAVRSGEIVFRLKDKDYRSRCTVTQYDYVHGEDELIVLEKATKGRNGGINLIFLGDGYDAEEISSGSYLQIMKEQTDRFFDIEPYRTYRDYFNVFTAIALSSESGISTVNTICDNRFGTRASGHAVLSCNHESLFRYVLALDAGVTPENMGQSLIVLTPNTTDYEGICDLWTGGAAVAVCPLSTFNYPYDSRGTIQKEAGGHGFGKLADETIRHNAFINACGCSCCEHEQAVLSAQALGWYQNISLSGKIHEVPWSHLVFHNRYSESVDIYEGACGHSRGVYRSEYNSCMNNGIPYYSTISRESIVRRILEYAGEPWSFETFLANDKAEILSRTKAPGQNGQTVRDSGSLGRGHTPRIHEGDPVKL